jgi:hypothetical protein
MGIADWFRNLFSPSPRAGQAGDQATLRAEYGAEVVDQPAPMGAAGTLPGVADVEDAKAGEDAAEADEEPPARAP